MATFDAPLPRHRFAMRRPISRGFSLIELMVSLVIGLVVTLAITGVMLRSEGNKRTNTSVNDVNQTGAFIAYVLDRAIRSAGSGFAQVGSSSYGCPINVTKTGLQLLPSLNAFPAPFSTVSQSVRLMPVLIGADQSDAGSDTLTVMAGSAGFGEAPTRVTAGSTTGLFLGLPNTLSFNGNDLVMVVESGVGCIIQQVASGFLGTPLTFPNTNAPNGLLNLGGDYASLTGALVNLTQFGLTGNAFIIGLGNPAAPSQLQIFGVGANNTLFSYDFLQLTTTGVIPVADGIVELRALYGIDTNGDGNLDSWVAPTGTYSVTNMAAASQATIKSIVAVRIGLVLRTSLPERTSVGPSQIVLFDDLGPTLRRARTLTTAEKVYRYRTIEETIPLRNAKF